MTAKLTQPIKWLTIPGLEFGRVHYEVSNQGDLRRVWRNAMDQWCDRLLKPDTDKRGRKRFTIRIQNKSVKMLASRLVLLAFVGPCPENMEACHENGDETDNMADNLRWDTHSANLLDRRRHGTNVQGEMVNTAKLTADNVREIRAIGGRLKPLALRFGVSTTLISFILRRKVWTHV